jgi:hypothetical protein
LPYPPAQRRLQLRSIGVERTSEALKGRAHPLPGINAGASRAPCFLVIARWACGATPPAESGGVI